MNTEKNSNMERQLTLTIGGHDVEDTKILFSVLGGKMDWLQKTLFNISLTESSDLVAQRVIGQNASVVSRSFVNLEREVLK